MSIVTVGPSDLAEELVNISQRFQAACLDVAEPDLAGVELLPELLARACAKVLDVAGASISVFAEDFRVPLGTSDTDASVAERLEFTFGEGPCLDAYRTAQPFRGDAERMRQRWPAFYGELVSRTPYRSIVSMPLQLGPSIGGAVDLYQHQPDGSPTLNLHEVAIVTSRVVIALSWQLTPKAIEIPGPAWLHSPAAHRRTRTWVAIGMLNYDFDLDTPDALARLRAYAFAQDQVLDDVVDDLVQGSLPVESLRP